MVRIIYYYLSYFSVTLILSLCFTPLMRTLAFKVGAVDRGEGRRIHKGIVPRLGGAGIFLAFILPVAFSLTRGVWDEFHDIMSGVLVASSLVFLIGLYDDIRGVRIRHKLAVEIAAALIIYFLGIRIDFISNPFGGAFVLGWLSLPATVLWIIIITNSINLVDGLDGLAAGTSILIASTLFILGGSDTHLQLILVILAGSLLGFMRYNFPPASIFMGDAGSLFLGFFLASISIVSSHKAAAMATMMIPVIAFGIPLMDMFYAVLRRFYRGLPLGEADSEHIHHKLLEKGLSKRHVLLVLYIANISIMFGILLIVKRQIEIDWIILVVISVLAIIGLRIFGYIEFLPIIREIVRDYKLNVRRRYFNYVIKRFKRDSEMAGNADDFMHHLTKLVKEYQFRSVEIHLDLPKVRNPVFSYYASPPSILEQVSLKFPVAHKAKVIGTVSLNREMNGDPMLCVSEMVDTLSEGIIRLAEIQYGSIIQDNQNKDMDAGLGL